MALVPLITSPCPLRWNGPPRPGADFCGHCQRRVHNLDLLGPDERATFLAGCSGPVCISYSVRRSAPLVAGLGALAVAASGAASGGEAGTSDAEPYATTIDYIVVGGTEAGNKLQWVDESELAKPDKPEIGEIQPGEWLPGPPE